MDKRKKIRGFSKHHRRCKSNGGKTEPKNISYVRDTAHLAYHRLFGNMTTEQIARVLNKTWLDPAWRLIAVKVNHDDEEE